MNTSEPYDIVDDITKVDLAMRPNYAPISAREARRLRKASPRERAAFIAAEKKRGRFGATPAERAASIDARFRAFQDAVHGVEK